MGRGGGGAGRARSGESYTSWLGRQKSAITEIKRITRTSNTIANPANRRKFLRREKQDFETKWTERFVQARARSQ